LAVVLLAALLFVWLREARGDKAAFPLDVTWTSVAQSDDSFILQLSSTVTLELVRVPAGEFIMGTPDSNRDADRNEMPQHTVYLDEYQVGKYEVTVAQWRAFVEATGYEGVSGSLTDPDDHPVRYVNYDDAVAFCTWASQATGRNVHLPTEAQWEKAARGADGRTYPWGESRPTCEMSVFYAAEACREDTAAVGSCSPAGDSPYGVADMAGNLWEWTQDWYGQGYYASSPESNPTGPVLGTYRALRGGGYLSNEWRMRTASRFRGDPTFRCVDLGFRVCVSPE